MRIDAHHHLWRFRQYDDAWITPELAPLRRDFLPADLAPWLERAGIDRTVLVQTLPSAPETRWFLELATAHPFIAGVVGWADLTAPDVEAQVDALRRHPKLVGLRHVVHDEPDVRWLARPEVRRGLAVLAERRLPYDLLIRPPHLGVALEVAQQFPELPLVVDHLAKPRIARGGWDDWADGLAALARCPNVWCKLSGMVTEADWGSWRPADLRRYVEWGLETFGVARVLFGSDWPVCLLAGTYEQVVQALEANVAHLGPDERAQLFGLNAARCYGLAG